MTHIRGGTEYLDAREMRVWKAVQRLNGQGRTTNSSQVATAARLSRNAVAFTASHLAARGYLRDVGKGAAYHWRITAKVPVQDPETIAEAS
jgi:hypothetical protein